MTIGQQIREELRLPLQGDRDWIRVEQGEFVIRFNPEHIARTRAEKARLHVEQDIRNFRRLHNRRRNDLVLS